MSRMHLLARRGLTPQANLFARTKLTKIERHISEMRLVSDNMQSPQKCIGINTGLNLPCGDSLPNTTSGLSARGYKTNKEIKHYTAKKIFVT